MLLPSPLPQGQDDPARSEMQLNAAGVSPAKAGMRLAVVALWLTVLSVVVTVGYFYLYTPIGFIRLGSQVQLWLIALPFFVSGLIASGAIVQGRRSLEASHHITPEPRRAIIFARVAIVLGAIEIVMALASLVLLWLLAPWANSGY
jgi:hypothetical protein